MRAQRGIPILTFLLLHPQIKHNKAVEAKKAADARLASGQLEDGEGAGYSDDNLGTPLMRA